MKHIEFIRKNLQTIAIVAAVIFAILFFKGCNDNRNAKKRHEYELKINAQNQRALTDSLRTVKNKAGETEKVISSFVTKLKDLEELNKDLHTEVKKEIGQVRALIKAGGVAGKDPFSVDNELVSYGNGGYGLKFSKMEGDTTSSYTLEGVSKFSLINNRLSAGQTDITNNKFKFDVVLGFKENNDNYEVFARSSSPYVEINKLSGVMLIPKRADITCPPPAKVKKFAVGPVVAYGIGTDFKPRGFIGIGGTYTFLRF